MRRRRIADQSNEGHRFTLPEVARRSSVQALGRFGPPVALGGGDSQSAAEWTSRIEAALHATQEVPAVDAMSRDPSRFETTRAGRAGVGGVYDVWRRLKSAARGERFVAGHGRSEGGGVSSS